MRAVAEGERYNAEVLLLGLLSEEKPRVERRVSCFNLTPDLAEHASLLWAKRWFESTTPQSARDLLPHPQSKKTAINGIAQPPRNF